MVATHTSSRRLVAIHSDLCVILWFYRVRAKGQIAQSHVGHDIDIYEYFTIMFNRAMIHCPVCFYLQAILSLQRSEFIFVL